MIFKGRERVCCKLISAKKEHFNFKTSLQKSLSATRNYATILFFMAYFFPLEAGK